MSEQSFKPTIAGLDNPQIPVGRALGDREAVADGQAVFGQVMGLVALTVGCVALGAYLARHPSGGLGIELFVLAFGAIIGLSVASARGHEQLAVGFLFGLGALLGAAIGPVLAAPAVLWQAAGATAAFIAALGACGYGTRRDLSSWARSRIGVLRQRKPVW
jgi:FtsH-binding integral membrane protein